MSRKVTRPRRHITCERCGRKTSTTYPPESGDLCLQCRARGKNIADRMPLTLRSKHELDTWLNTGGAA